MSTTTSRLFDLAPGAGNANAFDLVVGFAQSGRIDHMQGDALDVQGAAHGVARCSCHRRDDGQIIAGEAVERAGLTDIRLPRKHHMQAALQQPPMLGAVDHLGHFLLQPVKPAKSIGGFEEVNFLVGKIKRRLHQRPQFDKLVEEIADFPGKGTLQRADGAASGRAVEASIRSMTASA